MKPLFRYEEDEDGKLRPVRVLSDAANDGRGKVTRLADHIPGWWWSGWLICESCETTFVGILRCQSKTDTPPHRMECWKCGSNTAIPEAHWHAAAAVSCECGYEWRHVIVGKIDVLPTRLRCPSCGNATDRLEPWPP